MRPFNRFLILAMASVVVPCAAIGPFATCVLAQDPPGKPPPPAPVKLPPLDEGLDTEAAIRREALSDPRNLKRDAFPVLRTPVYVKLTDATGMDPDEWILGLTVGKTTLGFPVNVLHHHEIVVDERDDVPFLLCWCPLCRTGAAHVRALDGEILDFGHSGLLYRSSFLLYDKGTQSLWHHVEGRALTGRLRGRRLPRLPVKFLRWSVWRRAFPDSLVLAKDPKIDEHRRDAYAERNRTLKLTFGLGVAAGGEDRLYEISEMEKSPLVADTVGGVPILVAHHGPTVSTMAWLRTLDGVVLELRRAPDGDEGRFLLETTGQGLSTFDGITGTCIDGPLKGKSLTPAIASHWEVFAWMAHHPKGTTYRASVPPGAHLPDIPGGDEDGGDGADVKDENENEDAEGNEDK